VTKAPFKYKKQRSVAFIIASNKKEQCKLALGVENTGS